MHMSEQGHSGGSKAKVIAANRMLQVKAGRGKIEDGRIRACQDALEKNTQEFLPVAMDFLKQLEKALEEASKNEGGDLNEHKSRLFKPVFDLKANAKMFKYDLVTIMTNIMVDFLEKIETLDEDAVEIVRAHHKTLTLIVLKKMSGTGGEAGKALAKELQSACLRYFSKRKPT